MSPTAEQLLQSALALPAEDRVELAEALLAETDEPTGLPFNEAWLAEVQRRSAKIDAGTDVGTPWAEVKQRVRERIDEKSRG